MYGVSHSNGKTLILTGSCRLATDTIKVALMNADSGGTVFNPTSFSSGTYWSDISSAEISAGGGYSAGGAELSGVTSGTDTELEEGWVKFSNVSISNLTAKFQYLVLYKSTGNAATSPLLFYFDLTAPLSKSAENIVIRWSASGVVRIV